MNLSSPLPSFFHEQKSVVVRDMFARKKPPPKTPFDVARYKVIAPKKNDMKLWEEALAKARTQLEHQSSRFITHTYIKARGPKSYGM